LIGFHGDEICLITWILLEKLWSKIQVNGRLRSERWWRNRLQDIFNEPDVIVSPENLWDGKPAEPAPIPFEIEMGMPDLNYEMLLKAWKKTFPNA
jgi:hypothetical protein